MNARGMTTEAPTIGLYRQLAGQRPSAFLPDLARSLANLGLMRSGLDQVEEALEATREAVAFYRYLVAECPDAFLPDLARRLNILGTMEHDPSQRESVFHGRLPLAEIAPDGAEVGKAPSKLGEEDVGALGGQLTEEDDSLLGG